MQPDFIDFHRFQEMLDAPDKCAEFATMFPQARHLFEEYLAVSRPALQDWPLGGVTALQFTLFDNGAEFSGSKRLLTMKSRFGLNVKAWDRVTIDWTKSHQVAWEATACLRSADETQASVHRLIERELLSPEVATTLREMIAHTEKEGLFGICHQRKIGMGSRWNRRSLAPAVERIGVA